MTVRPPSLQSAPRRSLTSRYIGRFAPSPTGPLHAGSLVAALASWLDARAHDGRWLVRIEDIDTPRSAPQAAETLLAQLAGCGLIADEVPLWQSTRDAAYAEALDRLQAGGWAFPCGCTRREVEALSTGDAAHERHHERIYPGTCRNGLHGKAPRAMRVRCSLDEGDPALIDWHDRRLGPRRQALRETVGDFIVKRADGLWAYQLAVVVDDAAQGVTHIVRGEDLADNTPRQIHLQRLLAMPTPAYLHTPLVLGIDGNKLSKGNGAAAIEPGASALRAALRVLDMPAEASSIESLLADATAAWRVRWQDRRPTGMARQ